MGRITELKQTVQTCRKTIAKSQKELEKSLLIIRNLYTDILRRAVDESILTKDFTLGNFDVKVCQTDLGNYAVHVARIDFNRSLRIWTPLDTIIKHMEDLSNYDRDNLRKLKAFIDKNS